MWNKVELLLLRPNGHLTIVLRESVGALSSTAVIHMVDATATIYWHTQCFYFIGRCSPSSPCVLGDSVCPVESSRDRFRNQLFDIWTRLPAHTSTNQPSRYSLFRSFPLFVFAPLRLSTRRPRETSQVVLYAECSRSSASKGSSSSPLSVTDTAHLALYTRITPRFWHSSNDFYSQSTTIPYGTWPRQYNKHAVNSDLRIAYGWVTMITRS